MQTFQRMLPNCLNPSIPFKPWVLLLKKTWQPTNKKVYIASEAILEQMNLSTQTAQTSSKQVSAPFFTLSSRTSSRSRHLGWWDSPGVTGLTRPPRPSPPRRGMPPPAAPAERLPPLPDLPPGWGRWSPRPAAPHREGSRRGSPSTASPQPAATSAARKGRGGHLPYRCTHCPGG